MQSNELNLSIEDQERIAQYFFEHNSKAAFSLILDPSQKITPISSRIGGLPFWDFKRPYPCNNFEQPLRFICQINLQDVAKAKQEFMQEKQKSNSNLEELAWFKDMPQLPEHGLIQFYALASDCYGCSFEPNNDDCRVEFVEISKEAETLTNEDLEDSLIQHDLDLETIGLAVEGEYWPIDGECALKLVLGADWPHLGDFSFSQEKFKEAFDKVLDIKIEQDSLCDLIFNIDEDFRSFRLKALRLNEEQDVLCIGSFLGYPDFTQDNPIYTEADEQRFDCLLLRLDEGSTGKQFSMMWGDCGIANFFMNSKKLKSLDFSDIFYTWDCC